LAAWFFPAMFLLREKDYHYSSQYWREYERRIVMKQEENKKFNLLIYIGIILFCAFLIYQMLTPNP
jgi:ABC-type lipoprotein release transport system permease subunit